LKLKWTPGSKRQVFLICDAPCHGKKYTDRFDEYPGGSPEGLELETLMQEFHKEDIQFTIVKLDSGCDKMIKAMQDNHPGA